ncbi:hypothetical protein [Lacinutrix salivirga]
MNLPRLFINLFLLFFVVCTFAQSPEQELQFDEDFKSRYDNDKYNYEGKKVVGETPIGEGEIEDYKDGKPKVKEQSDRNNDSVTINFGPFTWLFYLLLIAAVIYLGYILLNDGSSGLFTSRGNKKIENFEGITAENIEHADIKSLIASAENNNDYRLATRYYYLLVLKSLSVKNHIKFEDDKTNADYLLELTEKPFSKKFEYISYLYNYIWYGEFPLDSSQYDNAKSQFVALLNQIK